MVSALLPSTYVLEEKAPEVVTEVQTVDPRPEDPRPDPCRPWEQVGDVDEGPPELSWELRVVDEVLPKGSGIPFGCRVPSVSPPLQCVFGGGGPQGKTPEVRGP